MRQRKKQEVAPSTQVHEKKEDVSNEPKEQFSTYWLARMLILRMIGGVYFVAFLSASYQAIPLIGENGLMPAPLYLNRLKAHYRENAQYEVPSVFWLVGFSDLNLQILCYFGLLLSSLVLIGICSAPLMLLLWFTYMSLKNVGQLFYGTECLT